ncbi:hypothetical protein HC928_02570 [bacterium]|nr:hypothetical protein [bacterium]
MAQRAPSSSDTGYPLGQEWIHEGTAAYILIEVAGGSATWEETGGGSVQVSSLNGDSGSATPTAGGITIAGGVNLTTSATASTVTVALDSSVSGLTSLETDVLEIPGGTATDFIGTATLTAGTVTIANTNIAATDHISLQHVAPNTSTTLGVLMYTIDPGVEFTINSHILGTPGSIQTGDLSDVSYLIVRQT